MLCVDRDYTIDSLFYTSWRYDCSSRYCCLFYELSDWKVNKVERNIIFLNRINLYPRNLTKAFLGKNYGLFIICGSESLFWLG